MKHAVVFIFILLLTTLGNASEITDSFSEKYKSLTPREGSSVQSDYLFEQIALGSEYTVRMLDMINDQNEDRNKKIDTMIEKLDILIDQNSRLLKLLEKKLKPGTAE